MTHICPFCSQPFEGRSNKKFCCRSHAEMYLRGASVTRTYRIQPNLTGKCLNCSADVDVPRRFCCDLCGKAYRQRKYDAVDYQKQSRRKTPAECHCHDYTHCIRCRNAERRRAFRAGEIPVYRLEMMRGA